MAGWKSSWNKLAVRLMLSFTAFVVIVTAVFSVSPYIFVRETLERQLAERGEALAQEDGLPRSPATSPGRTTTSIQVYVGGIPQGVAGSVLRRRGEREGDLRGHTPKPHSRGKPWNGPGAAGEGAGPRGRRPRSGGSESWKWRLPDRGRRQAAGDDRHRTELPGGRQHPYRGSSAARRLVGFLVLASSPCSASGRSRTHVVSGLTRLGKMTREVAQGELRERIPEEGFEEIRALARDFNAMAGNLRTILPRSRRRVRAWGRSPRTS